MYMYIYYIYYSVCAALSSDARLFDTDSGEEAMARPPVIHSMGDFPFEQSLDETLCSVFDQVMKIYGTP